MHDNYHSLQQWIRNMSHYQTADPDAIVDCDVEIFNEVELKKFMVKT